MTFPKNTRVYTPDNGDTVVQLYNTPIVRFNSETITLNTGGYETGTTKRRMNEVAKAFDLQYHVYQQNFKWFVQYGPVDEPHFAAVFDPDGTVTIDRINLTKKVNDV